MARPAVEEVDRLAESRKRVAQLTGTLMRVHASLNLVGSQIEERETALGEWCAEQERKKRESK